MDWIAIAEELNKKLDEKHVKTRTQGGATLAYIEGWHAIAEANRIFGHGEWSRETLDLKCVVERERPIGQRKTPGWSVTYTARVRVTVCGVTRDGVGSGHGIGTDIGECHESAIKEAETDATKRALMTFGWPFGLALYDKKRAHVGNEAEALADAGKRIKAELLSAASISDLEAAWSSAQRDIAAMREAGHEKWATALATLYAERAAALKPAPVEAEVNGTEAPF